MSRSPTVTGMFIGFVGYSACRIRLDDARVRTVASLLVDKRWPWAPRWAYFNLTENLLRRTRTRQVVGNKGRDYLIHGLSDPAHYWLHVSRSNDEQEFPAQVRVTTGSKAIPESAACPFDVNGFTRGDELPDGVDIARWIELVHELMVACDVACGVMPIWSTSDQCSSDLMFATFTLDTPRGEVNLGTPADFARQNRRANWWRNELGGTYVRHPRWGTYLSASHLERIGGRAKIEDAVQPARMIELGNLTFIQLTDHPKTALTAECERKRQALEAIMEPIVAPGFAKEDT